MTTSSSIIGQLLHMLIIIIKKACNASYVDTKVIESQQRTGKAISDGTITKRVNDLKISYLYTLIAMYDQIMIRWPRNRAIININNKFLLHDATQNINAWRNNIGDVGWCWFYGILLQINGDYTKTNIKYFWFISINVLSVINAMWFNWKIST